MEGPCACFSSHRSYDKVLDHTPCHHIWYGMQEGAGLWLQSCKINVDTEKLVHIPMQM
jgi:hypothetical protein